ncbi:VaFE repeat-containing surface-anchored protein [Candidatus Saccharibacteria bacterium]|nr:VaFE repeat-containing surface-anchored protein [Candidatus Saccharibacteria bacterium]
MFKLSRKSFIIRSVLSSIGLIAVLLTSFHFIHHTIIQANAITADGATITISNDGQLPYDGDNSTGQYKVAVNGQTFEAFCAQPSLSSPVGTTTATKLGSTENNNLIKFVIFLYQNNNSHTSSVRNAVFSAFPSGELFQWTHAIIGAIYYNDYGDLSSSAITKINNAITTLRTNINNNSDAWTIAKNYQLYVGKGYASGIQDVVWIENNYQYGSISVQKCDGVTNSCSAQGDANFSGIVFKVYNNSGSKIYNPKTDQIYANGALVATGTTNANGAVSFTNLLANNISYKVVEASTNTSYELTAGEQTTTLNGNGDSKSLKFYNTPVYGDITINKVDADSQTCTPYGNLSLDGTTFQLVNDSDGPIYYNGSSKAKGAVVDTKTLSNGSCSVQFSDLPYGKYIVEETAAAEGYVLNSTPWNVTIPNDGDSSLHVTITAENQIIRGDVKFVKMDEANNNPMSDVLFSISEVDGNNQLGETHIVVSNQDGVVNTSSSFAAHSFHTNGYDELYDLPDPVTFLGYGAWFGLDQNGQSLPVNDNLGALPYGTYVIQELKCGANLFCTGIKDQKVTITINTNNQVVDLANWNNTCTKFTLETQAVDAEDDDKYVEANKQAKIKDKISYCAKPNMSFTIKGVLMDKKTGEPYLENGQPVEQSIEITPEEECGEVEMIFTIDATNLGGAELVVFESMYYKDDIVVSHEDINDEAQTVEIVKLYTYATNDDTNEKILPLDEDVKIKDVVKYCLKPGAEYVIKGVVMNKETGEALLIDNEPVQQEITITPEEACGEVEMYYTLNTTGLGGTRLVIFESLYRNDELLLKHESFENADESVDIAPPVPDTGSFTDSNKGTKQNSPIILIVASTAVIVISNLCIRALARRRIFR